MVRGPIYSPLKRSTAGTGAAQSGGYAACRKKEESRPAEEAAARKKRRSDCTSNIRANDLAAYFFEEIRKYLEQTYGTEAVHERGACGFITTLNIGMQRAANLAVRDGLHSYDRRHGWRGGLPNILKDNSGHASKRMKTMIGAGLSKRAVMLRALVMAVDDKYATIKIGNVPRQ